MIAELDSLAQADGVLSIARSQDLDLRTATERRAASTRGLLRVARLVSDTVTIADVHLFDGLVLLELGPDGVRAALGDDTHLSLTVLCRSDTLDASLLHLLRSADSFAFSTLRGWGLDATLLQQPVDGERSESVRSIPEGFALLRARARQRAQTRSPGQTDPRPAVEWMINQWKMWLHEGTKMSTAPQLHIPECWSPDQPPDFSRWPAEAREIGAVLTHERRRSQAFDAINRAESLTRSSRERLRQWWNLEYLEAIAQSNDALWLRAGSVSATTSPTGSREHDHELRLSEEAMTRLQELPSAVYSWILFRAAHARESWDEHQRNALDTIAHVVRDAIEPIDIRRDRRVFTVRILLTVLVAGIGAVLSTNAPRWAPAWSAWIAIAIIGMLGAAPIGDIQERWRSRHARLAAIISRPDGSST